MRGIWPTEWRGAGESEGESSAAAGFPPGGAVELARQNFDDLKTKRLGMRDVKTRRQADSVVPHRQPNNVAGTGGNRYVDVVDRAVHERYGREVRL